MKSIVRSRSVRGIALSLPRVAQSRRVRTIRVYVACFSLNPSTSFSLHLSSPALRCAFIAVFLSFLSFFLRIEFELSPVPLPYTFSSLFLIYSYLSIYLFLFCLQTNARFLSASTISAEPTRLNNRYEIQNAITIVCTYSRWRRSTQHNLPVSKQEKGIRYKKGISTRKTHK